MTRRRKKAIFPLDDEPSADDVHRYFKAVDDDRQGDGISQGRLRYDIIEDDNWSENLHGQLDRSENVIIKILASLGFGQPRRWNDKGRRQ